MAPQLMWMGLGNIGRGCCQSLVERGSLEKPLLLYNRTASRAEELAAKLGPDKIAVLASILDGVAQADIIFSCFSNDAVLEDTYRNIIAATTTTTTLAGKLFVSCETIRPATANTLGALLTAHGAAYVACPVVGPPAAAAAGQLLCIPAGPTAGIDRLQPYLMGVMARAVIPFAGGDDLDQDQQQTLYGKALTAKIVANTCIFTMVTQLSEALTLAEKTEVGTAAVQQLVDVIFGGPFSIYAARMATGAYWKTAPLADVNLGVKDVSYALDLGKETGVRLRNSETALEYLKAVVEHSDGKGDIAGVYGVVRQNSGLKFENDA
ncbi:hypothetical protein N0V82_006738 [Gnomoniopsis sp. IMI 355080]|nr:hypothetical protein N0V82_006738 [Gnomoniopsis sp. IMI 355080]